MNLFLTTLLELTPTIGVAALLIGLSYLAEKRNSLRSAPHPLEEDRPALDSPVADRPSPPVAGDLQLTAVLAGSGEVLLGYRASAASTTSRRSSVGVSPLATGTLLFSLGQDPDGVLSILDGWCREDVELALRLSDNCDVVELWDRRTAQRLVLSQLRVP